MVEEKHESSRNLLDQIEGDWDSPAPGPVRAKSPSSAELDAAALDAAAARLVESLDPPPVSVQTLDDLDAGWGDEEEDEEEEEEEPEPELPDERADPVAYAVAKKARDERVEAKRLRRRAKDAAKKARRKARVDAQKSKQKGKSKKARPAPAPAQQSPRAERKAAARAAAAASAASKSADGAADSWSGDGSNQEDAAARPSSPSRVRAKLPPSKIIGPKPMLSKTSAWMLGIAVILFIAAAIFAAVIAR